jgi:hypothetical protein
MGLQCKISGSGGLSPGRPTAGFATGRAGFRKAVVSDGTRRSPLLGNGGVDVVRATPRPPPILPDENDRCRFHAGAGAPARWS